ncbi:hypothetical protein [Paraburkholderia sp. BL6665CI2N2]|nr:hypothetical protein [Paraburkholderia sp. BL6665CI2N2]
MTFNVNVAVPVKRLESKVAIVTGAAVGIGKSTSQWFAKEGVRSHL